MAKLRPILSVVLCVPLLSLAGLPPAAAWPSDPALKKSHLPQLDEINHSDNAASQEQPSVTRETSKEFPLEQSSVANRDVPSEIVTFQINSDQLDTLTREQNPPTVVIVEFPEGSVDQSTSVRNSGLVNQTLHHSNFNILPLQLTRQSQGSESVYRRNGWNQPTARKINIDTPKYQLLQTHSHASPQEDDFPPAYTQEIDTNQSTFYEERHGGESAQYSGLSTHSTNSVKANTPFERRHKDKNNPYPGDLSVSRDSFKVVPHFEQRHEGESAQHSEPSSPNRVSVEAATLFEQQHKGERTQYSDASSPYRVSVEAATLFEQQHKGESTQYSDASSPNRVSVQAAALFEQQHKGERTQYSDASSPNRVSVEAAPLFEQKHKSESPQYSEQSSPNRDTASAVTLYGQRYRDQETPYPEELSHSGNSVKAIISNESSGQVLSTEQVLELLRRSARHNHTEAPAPPPRPQQGQRDNERRRHNSQPPRSQPSGFFEILLESLRNLPVVGNVLRAQVDPVYRPILNSILPSAQSRQSTDEFLEERHCFGKIGCFETTIDFYDPIIRPINLPPDTREAINTHYTLYTRTQPEGVPLTRHTLGRLTDSSYNPASHTKFVIHGFLDDQNSTWIKEMVRGLLHHGDYNVFTVDWSGGSRVIYHQAVTNIRVVALEVAALINSLKLKLGQDPAKVHLIGHSLGSHTAGYIGERVPGLGRITGLDPAEPFFQYMPPSVRLDPSDASFVDVIHTDTDSIITLAWQFAGYGLEQPIGHVDFYPNGGRGQPGCSSLSRIALTALRDGSGIIEGLDAAEKEAVACNHIRSSKLFTASLFGTCSFMAFPCKSYDEFEKARCFSCDTELGCAPLGIHADTWQPRGRENVNMYLSTSGGPDFCQYHYRLTVTLADERRQGGSLHGRLKVTFITPAGELRDFQLAEDSPMSFKRGSSRTFLLRHGEDLSGSRDALVTWRYEADVFNPLTFCVLFCTPELELSTVTLTPLDTPLVAGSTLSPEQRSSPDIVMCHKQGQAVIKLDSDQTIKISAEPFCPQLETQQRNLAAQRRRGSEFLFPGNLPVLER